ncbi:D-alanyl-D-alanine carboxypeptidase [Bacillus sp. NTK071]|uniref:D-alanyl-D-alanine carboxypeptidase family protein n=1 Tax=Bacillus sp. NTK071 TaxID=2802175 RepID=UPI001A90255F|nr:D-alanyl-D-alanine carboxypeptidase family protein [Bacillus sp. NTK071]MBN8207936.1 D-alanyl-D-alanine carboxypeptidase [Bacillus sp. NTK071]
MIRKKIWLIPVVVIMTAFLFPETLLAQQPPDIKSETAILIDGKTGQILFEKNSQKEMYPASITKIVTALMAVESGKMSDSTEVSKKAREVDGTRVYLEEGEIVPLEQLVKGMLVNSGNDAAIAIAEHLSGSVDSFADDMNTFVKEEVGVENSHFTNPHGLFDVQHVTTAEDMAKITQYAMKNQQFKSIFGVKELEWSGEDWNTTLINHHRLLLDYVFVTGGKNGFVSESGFTLVTTATKGNQELIAVTMKATDDQIAYQDTLTLLNYGFDAFSPVVFEEGTELAEREGKEYFLAEDLTLFQQDNQAVEISVNDSGRLESDTGSIQSVLDSEWLSSSNTESTSSKDATKVASTTNEKEKDPFSISSKLIFYIGISVFTLIMIALFIGSKPNKRRSRTFPY